MLVLVNKKIDPTTNIKYLGFAILHDYFQIAHKNKNDGQKQNTNNHENS